MTQKNKKTKPILIIPMVEIKAIRSIFNCPVYMNRSSPSESDFEKMMESHLELWKLYNKLLKTHNEEMNRI